MDILLLNDTTWAPWLPSGARVLSAGPEARYVMPEQDNFDVRLGAQLEHELSHVLARCREKIPDFDPQVIVQFETSQNYFYRGIERSSALTVWRVVDTHMFYDWQPFYAHLFDVTLVAQKDYLPRFADFTPRAHWLPLSTNVTVHHDRGLPRDIPVSFVGSMNAVVHPERVRFFEALQQRAPVRLFSGKTQEEIASLYNRSLIVINECLYRDLNYRLFEAMSNGALCLTPRIDAGQAELFPDGEALVEYEDRDADDAAAKIHALLADRARLDRIRRQGYACVMASHDIRHRVEAAWEWIDFYLKNRPARDLRAEKLCPSVSLLAEFTFVMHLVGGLHMQDLIRAAGERSPRHTAYYLTSLSSRWLERAQPQAASYFLQEALALPYHDDALDRAHQSLRSALKG